MNILGTFIEQASNIWWGIAAAIVVVAVLYFIIYALHGGARTFSPLSLLPAIPLLPLLSFQFFLLFGSISLKHTCKEVASWIDVLVPDQSPDHSFSREDVNAVVAQAVSVFPMATKLIDTELITQNEDMSLGKALTHKVQGYLNWYIVRRVAWSLGFIVVAVIVSILMIRPTTQSRRPHRPQDAYQRRNRQRVSRRNRNK